MDAPHASFSPIIPLFTLYGLCQYTAVGVVRISRCIFATADKHHQHGRSVEAVSKGSKNGERFMRFIYFARVRRNSLGLCVQAWCCQDMRGESHNDTASDLPQQTHITASSHTAGEHQRSFITLVGGTFHIGVECWIGGPFSFSNTS